MARWVKSQYRLSCGGISLEAYAEWKILSFHVDVLIFTFYFVINTKPHFAQQETLF